MRRFQIIFTITALFVLSFGADSFADETRWQDISKGMRNLKTVLVHPVNPGIIYLGAKGGIFKSEDKGESWRLALSLKGEVNFLIFDPKDNDCLYAATSSGLYWSNSQGKRWQRIFKGRCYLENECRSIAILSADIYLGTKAGLFISRDNGRSWHKEKGRLGGSNILAIAYNKTEPNYIYVASIDGVFRIKGTGEVWERIFVARPVENGFEAEEDNEARDEEEKFSGIRYIICGPNNLNCLYAATSKGINRSCDRGQSWEALSSYGLLNGEVKFLLFSNRGSFYAVTKSGIFEYRANRWQELSFGLAADEVRFLALDNQNNLYAVSDKGLFKANTTYSNDDGGGDIISLYYKDEPKINEVQQAAIKYAEVEPEKIARWRREARMKAALPKLTVGLDRSESTNYEIYTSATAKYAYEGPRDKSNGWDVTLSWELGDLIWNEAQASIDVRSRLMVELRGGILDEVTKLYFERLRVKMEMDNLSIEDRKKKIEKELRLEELTASLDALTGGYFSKKGPVPLRKNN